MAIFQFFNIREFLSTLLIIITAIVSTLSAGIQYVYADERDITEDEIREYGIISHLEDSGYPMFNVTVSFPERNMEHVFLLNAEGADLGGINLFENIGRYATIYYQSNTQNALLDMHVDGETIFGEYGGLANENANAITGVLEGAYEVTAGDLPDVLFVSDKVGKTIRFEFFITEDIVALNGTTVTAYFEPRDSDDITYMRFAE